MRLVFLLPVIWLLAGCTTNNVTTDDSLKTFFDEQRSEGCFALFNNGNGQFTIYNLPRYRDSSFLPAATFDVVNALIGLQTGVLANDTAVLRTQGDSASAAGENLASAFRSASLPFFQNLARRTGKDTLQHWLDSLAYGGKRITTAIDSFWFDNSLRLTPDEQLGVVKRLYFNQLPFFNNYQLLVKDLMKVEDKPTHLLYYRAAAGRKPDGTAVGWAAGWVEENRHPYFFVVNLETKDPSVDARQAAVTAAQRILARLNFFKGQR